VVLYHAAFGFTSAWRVFIAIDAAPWLRAQMLMLAITCAVFFRCSRPGRSWPAAPRIGLANRRRRRRGRVHLRPRMQLGAAALPARCSASGGGSTRMLVTLFFFIIGR
jgi:hypothetical protein